MSDNPTALLERPGSVSTLLVALRDFQERFTQLADAYDGTTAHAADLEAAMAAYAQLVTDPGWEAVFALADATGPGEFADLVADLRLQSARCAGVCEKHRALRLLDGQIGTAGYFTNVESCIEQEFGACGLSPDAAVLLVGSGSFPMTPLNLARRTGARVVGIDIDPESVALGRRVVEALGLGLDITLTSTPVEQLPFTAEASHVIFSSTVALKYALLDRLHPLTRDDVVVAMRFGDGLKSLFNYPSQPVDPARWVLAETVRRPEQVFDIALYRKAGAAQVTR